jgi:hypothetical protein
MNGPEKTIAEFFAGIGLMRIGHDSKSLHVAFASAAA